ncbi:MAG: hypothetical protein K6357_06125 [Elusimicrobiota bacterium]
MKKVSFSLISVFILPVLLFSQIKEDAKSLKNELKKGFFSTDIQKPVKIAVMDFDEKSEDAKKSKAGAVFPSALAEQFIKDSDFIVAERQKLESVFKELKLSASGVIDQKELKRTGLILGVDWLVVGDISDSGEDFLVQARIVNVETGVAVSAGSVMIERTRLIKESEEYFSKKYRTVFYLSYGNLNIEDIKFNPGIITAQIRRKFGKIIHLVLEYLKIL